MRSGSGCADKRGAPSARASARSRPSSTRCCAAGIGHSKHADKFTFRSMDGFVRRRLRAILRKQSKRPGMGHCDADHKRWPNASLLGAGAFHHERSPRAGEPVPMRKTTIWRAVCGRTACTVRRAGRPQAFLIPISIVTSRCFTLNGERIGVRMEGRCECGAITAPGSPRGLMTSTAGCGQPHVRRCGRGDGRYSVTPNRSRADR